MFIRTEGFKDFIRFYPIVTSIIVIQILIWVTFIFIPPFENPLFVWGAGINILVGDGEYWRLFTPIFLHNPSGVMHVLFNSFSLVLFGPALEQMLGKFKFIVAYLVTGVVGNIFTYIVDPLATNFHVGASGAIYGLLGIYIYMIYFKKHLIDRGNAQIVTTIFIIGLVMSFLRPGINIYAHIFGFIGGFALGPIILTKAQPFSIYRNRRRSLDGVNFDPHRWNRKQFSLKRYAKPLIWGFIILLVLLGLFGRFL